MKSSNVWDFDNLWPSIIKMSSAEWAFFTPEQNECGELEDPKNGKLACKLKQGTAYCRVKCYKGFMYENTKERSQWCKNGRWMPRRTPRCVPDPFMKRTVAQNPAAAGGSYAYGRSQRKVKWVNGVLIINRIGGSEISADIQNSIHRKLKSFGRMFSQFLILPFLQNCLISKRSRFNPDIAEMMSLFGDEFLDSPFITQEPASCEKDSFKTNRWNSVWNRPPRTKTAVCGPFIRPPVYVDNGPKFELRPFISWTDLDTGPRL